MRAETSKTENEKIENKVKSWFFMKSNKIDKLLVRITKKEMTEGSNKY